MAIHTIQTLVPLIMMLPPVLDYERPVRQPIPRHEKIVTVYVTAAMDSHDPVKYAVWLDVLGAHESGYDSSLVGDSGASCGAWQTPCARTPGFRPCTSDEALSEDRKVCSFGRGDLLRQHGQHFTPSPTVGLEQARVATAILKEWDDKCAYVIWGYALGRCERSSTAEKYMVDVDAELRALESP